MNARTAVSCRAISRRFDGGAAQTVALDGIDIAIAEGSRTVLTGPSGSGKSTLLALIGLLDRPTSGSLALFGEPAPTEAVERELFRRTRLGFVFQSFNLVPTLAAHENVELAILLTEPDAARRRLRAMQALASVGLDSLSDRRPGQLSGGQQQRVAIARAIVNRARLILADEPTANLDRAAADAVLDVLCNLHAELGVTIIVSSHDPAVCAIANDRIDLRDGRVTVTGGGAIRHAQTC